MPTINGFTINILVDQQPLPEYDTKSDEGRLNDEAYASPTSTKHVSCWIESREDQEFSLEYIWNSLELQQERYEYDRYGRRFSSDQEPGYSFMLKCDGQKLTAFHSRQGQGRHVLDSVHNDGRKYKPCFTKLALTDDEEARDLALDPLFGTIEIIIWRISPRWEYAYTRPSWNDRPVQAFDTAPIHESKKKLGSHRVGLGAEVPMDPQPSWRSPQRRVIRDRLDRKPCMVFTFYYGSSEMLQAKGLLKRPSRNLSDYSGVPTNSESSTSLSRKRKAAEMEDQRDRETEQRNNNDPYAEFDSDDEDALQAELTRLNEKLNQMRSKRVKREPSPIRITESIDLTNSDENRDSNDAHWIAPHAKPKSKLNPEIIDLVSDSEDEIDIFLPPISSPNL